MNARTKLQTSHDAIKRFHEGLIARKKEGFKDIKEEASYLFGQMKSFTTEPSERHYEWRRLDKEIEYLEKEFQVESIIKLYDEMFVETPRRATFRVFSQKHKEFIKNTQID